MHYPTPPRYHPPMGPGSIRYPTRFPSNQPPAQQPVPGNESNHLDMMAEVEHNLELNERKQQDILVPFSVQMSVFSVFILYPMIKI